MVFSLSLSMLSGLLRNNGPAFLPAAVSPRLRGLAQAPGDEPLPLALLGWVPMPWDCSVAFQHPGLQRAPRTGDGVRDLSFQRASLRALEWGGKAKINVCAEGSACCLSPVLC